jgi:hypothetical protein
MKTIIDLLNDVGIDNVGYQMLNSGAHPCLTNINTGKRGDSTVTFGTDALNAMQVANNTGRVGIIIWAEREPYEAAVKKMKGQ